MPPVTDPAPAPDAPSPGESLTKTGRRIPWFPCIVALMVGLFLVTIFQRDRLRAHWWALRAERATDPVEQAQLVAWIAGVGEPGRGVLAGLADSPSPNVRILAIAPLAGLEDDAVSGTLRQLLHDEDAQVRHAAGLALVFQQRAPLRSLLIETAMGDAPHAAAAAAAALARDSAPESLCALTKILASHASAHVRAQAAESIIDRLAFDTAPGPSSMPATPRRGQSGGAAESPCDVAAALLDALSDEGEFISALALEQEIAEAQHFIRTTGAGGPDAFGSAHSGSALRRAVGEVCRTLLAERLGVSVPPEGQISPQGRTALIDAIRDAVAKGTHAPPAPNAP